MKNKENLNVHMSTTTEKQDVIIETTNQSRVNEESIVCNSETNIKPDTSEEKFDITKSDTLSSMISNMGDRKFVMPPQVEFETPECPITKIEETRKLIDKDDRLSDIDKLSKEDEFKRESVREIVNTHKKTNLSFVVSHISLGLTLVEIKKEVKDRFFNVIDEEVLPKKQVHRLMKLVLKDDVDFKTCMKTNVPFYQMSENLKSFELDTRVIDLVNKDLTYFYNLSITKINKIKCLNYEDFEKVVTGNDQPYIDLLEKEKKERKKLLEDEHNKKKSDKVSEEEFDKLYKKNKYELINSIVKKDSDIKKFKKKYRDTQQLLDSRDLELSLLKGRHDILNEIVLHTKQFNLNDNSSQSKSNLQLVS